MTGSETKIRKRWLKTNSDWLEAGPPQTFKRRHMQFLLFLLYLINKVECQEDVLSPSVSATCSQGFMKVRLRTKSEFNGVIHARDSRDNACLTYGTGDTATFLTINLLTPPNHPTFCGVVHDNSSEKSSLAVAVRGHRTLELAADNYYVITCGRSGFRNPDTNTTSTVKLLLTREGKKVTEATYGKEYKLQAEMDKSSGEYGIRVRNCFAFSDYNSSVKLINDMGCPEKNVISQFVFDGKGASSASLYSMFRFPDSNTVHFQCDILLCSIKSCQESLCVTDPVTSARVGIGGEGDDNDHRMMASTTIFVLEPGASALASTEVCELGPPWLLWLCVVFGVLFLIMLCVNVFLCSAMTCSFSKTNDEVEEKAGSIYTVQDYDPYRSWSGSQYGSRFSLDHPGTRTLETSRPLGPEHPGTRVLSPASLPYTSLHNSKSTYSSSRPSSRNGKVINGNGSLHYDNGGLYNGLNPRPPPALYQPSTPSRSRTPTRTPRSRARARHRAREAGQFDLAPDQYSLHSRPASQAGSYRNAMRTRVPDM